MELCKFLFTHFLWRSSSQSNLILSNFPGDDLNICFWYNSLTIFPIYLMIISFHFTAIVFGDRLKIAWPPHGNFFIVENFWKSILQQRGKFFLREIRLYLAFYIIVQSNWQATVFAISTFSVWLKQFSIVIFRLLNFRFDKRPGQCFPQTMRLLYEINFI